MKRRITTRHWHTRRTPKGHITPVRQHPLQYWPGSQPVLGYQSKASVKKMQMYGRIAEHGEKLKTIFRLDKSTDSIVLSKKLRRLESQGNAAATAYANGEIDSEQFEGYSNVVMAKVDAILHFRSKGIPVFLNSDPRGYALKIKDDYVREKGLRIATDWGGYGIIAPDVREG